MNGVAPSTGAAAPANVCGLVVHVRPDLSEALQARIAALPGVEIHLAAEAGRLVVTAVDEGGTLALDQIAAINRIPGVVSTSLVYHALDIAD
jgi:periplasmic nitrate reductase NapD